MIRTPILKFWLQTLQILQFYKASTVNVDTNPLKQIQAPTVEKLVRLIQFLFVIITCEYVMLLSLRSYLC